MDEAQEKEMDLVAGFKEVGSLSITSRENNASSSNLKTNMLAASSRYGYIFYATETDGLAIIPSARLEHKLQRSVSNENDPIIYRSYLPDQATKPNSSLIPYWIALNCDDSILAVILLTVDGQSSLLIFYNVVQFIQKSDPFLICPVMRLSKDQIGDSIQQFIWNPSIPNLFAYLDGLGCVSIFSVDPAPKLLGKGDANANNSSICWSPKGKQLVVVKHDGSMELFEHTMQLKKKHPSLVKDSEYPPCVSVLWISANQFLLGFSKSNTSGNELFQVMATYNKDQPFKTQIFNDLFFDVSDVPANINPQFFYARLNDNKILISGLSQSIKINVLGADELRQDFYDIWTLPEHLRADVRGPAKLDRRSLKLTGMALSFNSRVVQNEFRKTLPPCPMLLLSNSEGVLQAYYFIHENLPSVCRAPEPIKQTTASFPRQPSVNDSSITSLTKELRLTQSPTSTLEDFREVLTSLVQSTPTSTDLNKSVEELTNTLQEMTITAEKSMQAIKGVYNEHIEFLTKIENTRHRLWLIRKENLYHLSGDRQVDQGIQSSFHSIRTRCNQLKREFNDLQELTRLTIDDQSSTETTNDAENDVCIPNLQTLDIRERMDHRLRQLSGKLMETEKDLERICSEFNQSVIPSTVLSRSQKPTLPPVDSESFNNLLRIVQASIGLYFGETNPERLQELSQSIITSSLSSIQRSSHTSMISAPIARKVSTLTKATQTEDLVQTPGTNDMTKPQTGSSAADSTIRSLLNNIVALSTNKTPTNAQLGTAPSPVQVTSPTTKPAPSAGRKSSKAKPAPASSQLTIPSPFGSTMPFGNISTAATTTSATTSTTSGSICGTGTTSISAIPNPFGSGFGTSPSTTPASTASANLCTTGPFSTTSPFGAATITTPAPKTSVFGAPAASVASPFGTPKTTASSSIFGAPASPPSPFTTGVFGTVTTSAPSPFGTTTTASTPTVGMFGSSTTTSFSPFGAPVSTSASPTGGFGSGFGSSAVGTSPSGGGFTSSTPTTGFSFSGFGSTSTATDTSGGFGESPTMGSGASTTGFSASPSFRGSFAGFGTASKSSAPTSGFPFGGFGGQSTDTVAPPPTFAAFGSPAPPQASFPPGGSLFGAPPASATGFNASSSAFGGPPTQSATSPTFTSYRK